MPYVFSTATNDTIYREYGPAPSEGGLPTVKQSVTIKGGANRAVRGSANIITPVGMATRVAEDDLAFLQQNDAFKRHMRAGFVSVSKAEPRPEKAAASQSPKDASAPATEADIAARSKSKTKVSAATA